MLQTLFRANILLMNPFLLSAALAAASPVDDAREHWSRGESRAAGSLLKRWLEGQPDDAEARLLLAAVYLDFRQGEAAESELRKAMRAGASPMRTLPSLARAWLAQGAYRKLLDEVDIAVVPEPRAHAELAALRGDAQRALGNAEGALAEYERALELDPSQVDALIGRSRLALADNRIREVREGLLAATRAQPLAGRLWALLGELEFAQGNLVAAEQALVKAVIGSRSTWLPRLKRALVRLEAGQLEAARADIDAVAAEFPGYPGLLLARGSLLVRQGNTADGLAALNAYREYDPANLIALYLAAIGEMQRGNVAQSEELLRGFLARSPQSVPARRALAQVLLARGESREAERLLREALAAHPDHPRLLVALAEALTEQRRYQEAVEPWLRSVGLAPDVAAYRVAAAQGLYRAGELDAALAQLDAALELEPLHRTAPLLKIKLLLEQNQPEPALALARMLADARHTDPLAMNAVGLARLANGDVEGARAAFAAALESDPGYPDSGLNLAKLELRNGDTEGARVLLREVLSVTPGHVQAILALADLDGADGGLRGKEQRLRAAVDNQPDEHRFRLALAQNLVAQGALQQADALLQAAPASIREVPEVLLLHGQIQASLGDFDQAAASFRAVQSRLPSQAAAHFLLALVYAEQDRLDMAEQTLTRGVLIDASSPYLRAALNRTLAAFPDPDRALALVDRLMAAAGALPQLVRVQAALLMDNRRQERAAMVLADLFQRYPNDATVMRELVVALRAAGDKAGAERILDSWMTRNPDDAAAALMLAQVRDELGDTEAATALLEDLLSRDVAGGHLPVILNNLAWMLRETDPRRARGHAERALIANPGSPAIKDTLANLLLDTGDNDRALALLEEAHLADPTKPTIGLGYARALARAGRVAEARVILRRIVDKTFPEQDAARELLAELEG